MHTLAAAKGDLVWIQALCLVALVVPLTQLCRLSLSKGGLRPLVSLTAWSTALGTTAPCMHPSCNTRLPFKFASWAFPMNLGVAASQHLLWCFHIFAMVPEFSNVGRYSSQRIVQAQQPVAAVGALCTRRSLGHTCCPDVGLPGWASVTLPHNLQVAVGLDLDCSKVHVASNMPLLSQLWTQQADVR